MKIPSFILLVLLAHEIHSFAVPNDDIRQYLMARPKRDGPTDKTRQAEVETAAEDTPKAEVDAQPVEALEEDDEARGDKHPGKGEKPSKPKPQKQKEHEKQTTTTTPPPETTSPATTSTTPKHKPPKDTKPKPTHHPKPHTFIPPQPQPAYNPYHYQYAPPPSNEIPEYSQPPQPAPHHHFYGPPPPPPPPQQPPSGYYSPPAQFEAPDNYYRHSNNHHEVNQQRQHSADNHQHQPANAEENVRLGDAYSPPQSYAAPASYAQPSSSYASPQYPAAQYAQPHYAAPQYAPRPVQCPQNLLFSCRPTVQPVPCGQYSAAAYGEPSYAAPNHAGPSYREAQKDEEQSVNEKEEMLGRPQELMRIDVFREDPAYAEPEKHHRKHHTHHTKHNQHKHHKQHHKTKTEKDVKEGANEAATEIKKEPGIKTEPIDAPGSTATSDNDKANDADNDKDAGDSDLGQPLMQAPPSMQPEASAQQLDDSTALQSQFMPSNVAAEQQIPQLGCPLLAQAQNQPMLQSPINQFTARAATGLGDESQYQHHHQKHSQAQGNQFHKHTTEATSNESTDTKIDDDSQAVDVPKSKTSQTTKTKKVDTEAENEQNLGDVNESERQLMQAPPAMQQMPESGAQQIEDSMPLQSQFMHANNAFDAAPQQMQHMQFAQQQHGQEMLQFPTPFNSFESAHHLRQFEGTHVGQAQMPPTQPMPQMPQFTTSNMAMTEAQQHQMRQMQNPQPMELAQNQPRHSMLQSSFNTPQLQQMNNQNMRHMENPHLAQFHMQQQQQQLDDQMAAEFLHPVPTQTLTHEQGSRIGRMAQPILRHHYPYMRQMAYYY